MKNFAWVGTWAVTERCNLKCTYCSPPRLRANHPEDVDYGKAIDRIAALAPKVLNLSGGEPSLVEALPSILQRIKERWNPFIRIVHNGTQPLALIPATPFFDRLVISLDGPGELNRKTRGIHGDRVLKNLSDFLAQTWTSGKTPEVVINLVVTTENALEIRRLAEAMARIDPKIEIAFSALVPTDHTLSIITHPEIREAFWEEYDRLRAEGYPVWEHFEHFRADHPVKVVQCVNQFFVVHFWPNGTSWTCTPDVAGTVTHTGEYARKLWNKPGLLPRAFGYGWKLVKRTLSPAIDFECRQPCNCEAWLDALFTTGRHPNLDYYFKPLFGKFTEKEVDSVVRWIRRHVNPEFRGETLAPLIRKES